MIKQRYEFIINILYFLIILALFYFALKLLLPLLLPFLIAFLAAALLDRPITTLSKRFPRLPRKLIAAAVILVTLTSVGSVAVLLGGALIDELLDFIADIPEFITSAAERLLSDEEAVYEYISTLPPWLSGYAEDVYSRFISDVPGFLLSLTDRLSTPLMNSFGAIGSFAMRLPSAAVYLLITVIMIFFIGLDYGNVRSLMARAIPQRVKKYIHHIRSCSVDTVLCLLKTYAFLMLLTFTELAVGFAAINLLGGGIAHAISLALITAMVDILPVLGVGTVLLPWAAYDMLFGSTSRGIMLLVLYAIIVVIRNFLEPKMVGERFGLHPAFTLLALYVGGKLFGFIGVFLLPLLVIVIKRLVDIGLFKEQINGNVKSGQSSQNVV